MSKLKPNQFILDGHLITEIPLLFQTEMVKAILEGRKTQTRRTRGLESKNQNSNSWHRDGNPMNYICRFWDGSQEEDPNPIRIEFGFKHIKWVYGDHVAYMKSTYGKPGDILWLRETWGYTAFDNTEFPNSVLYKADFIESNKAKMSLASDNWKPSIHMPKAASRIWLMIEDIRAERLQDISEEDAIAEGIELVLDQKGQKRWKRYDNVDCYPRTDQPFVSFWSLWESINGAESWDQNPWVWVIKYRILSKTGRPSDDIILQNYQEVTSHKTVLGV